MEVAMISQQIKTTNKPTVPKVIGGAGSSKGGGGGKEADDNLESTATLSIIELLGEGQIGGLVDKSPSSIFLNDTPLANSSGIYNFNNVKWAFVEGTQSQESLGDGYNEVENSYSVNTKVTKEAPVKFTITDPNADKVRAIVSVPTLISSDSKGNINGTHVEFRFSISLNNGPFKAIGNGKITGKTRTKYQREYSYELPKNTDDGKKVSMWTIQVERMTAESSKTSLSNDLFVDNYSVITASRLSYPNSAIVGISFDAEQFQGVPERSYLVDGLLIKVPSNRDNKTRKYTGTWDGTYKLAVCDNPAWILYDILTNKRYGLGNYVPPEYANPARLYVIGKYCDEMVDNGFGELEPRFSINTCITTRMDAHQLISEVSSVFNGMTYWTGDQMGYMCDMPTPVTMRYTAANVIDGEFVYAGAQRKDIHSTVLVSWNDPENNYHTATEYVSDPEMVERFGIRTAEISAFGCTSRAQAVRVGRWLLHTERHQSKTISFKVGIDSAFVMPGDVIEILDPNRSGKRQGGRIASCSKTSAILDGKVEFEKGATVSIRLEDGTFADRIIEAVTLIESGASKVTWKTPLTTLPVANALWVIKTPTLSPLAARVVAVGQGENLGEFSITAIQHNETKFDHIEKDMMLETPNITVIEPNLITAPKSVEISNESRIEQSLAIRNMIITWEQVKDAIGYEVVYRKGDGNWFTLPTTKMPLVEVTNVQQGTYTAKVTAISASGAKSSPTWSLPTEIEGQVAELPKLAWLKATPAMFSIELTWSLRNNTSGVAYTEIEVSEDDGTNFKPLTVIPDPAKEYVHTGLALGNKRTYRARLVDTYGFKSEWSDLASASPDTDPSKVLEVLQDQIGINELDKDVTGSIDSAAKEAQEALKESKKAHQKIVDESLQINQLIAQEQKNRSDAFIKEAKDRSTEIKNVATKEANDRNAAIKVETDARLSDVKKLQDGITKETQERKTETGKLLESVETFKTSTNNSLGSVQNKITANSDEISAQAKKVEGIDSRLKNTDKTANDAREAAATAQTTANTAVSKAEANASKVSSLDASMSTTTATANNAALLSKYQSGGKPMSDDPSFMNGNGGVVIYNNGALNGSFVRAVKQPDNPTSSTHEMVRTTVNTMGTGIGWYFHPMVAAANRVYLIKQIVKLPVGFRLDLRSNSIGSGGNSLRWLSDNVGTGKYETYWSIAICGENGPFSSTGHIALTALPGTPQPTPENPLVAYLASYEWWDCTAVNDTIPKAWRDSVEANAKATSGLEARVTDSEGVIKSQSKSFEELKNSLTITNEKVDKKAESSVLSQTNSTVQKQGEELLAQSDKIDSLSAAISTSTPEYRFTATVDALENLLFVEPIGKSKVKLINESSAASGNVMRIGINSGDDTVILLGKTFVPIDPDKLYRIRYRYRRVQGDGSTYLSLVCANADKSAHITATNVPIRNFDISNSNYFVVNQTPKLGEWVVGEAFIKGKAAAGATGDWSKANPRSFPALSAFFRIGFLPNYSRKAGVQDFDYIIIEDYDAMLANESTSEIVKTVETSVKNINGKVETNSNAIDQITGQVKSLEDGVKKKADTEILKSYSTKTETDQAIAKGIESYNAGLSIGGGNILANGDVVKDFTRWSFNSKVSHHVDPNLKTRIVRLEFADDSVAQGIISNDPTMTIRAGVKYVASFLARIDTGAPIAANYNYILGEGVSNQIIGPTTISSTEWTRFEIPFTAARTGKFQLLLGSNSAKIKGRKIDYAEFQVQEGSKATEWTKPLSTLENSLNANSEAIQSTQADVKNVAGKVEAQSTQMNSLKSEINQANSNANKAINNAATAQTTANTAVSQAAAVASKFEEFRATMKVGGGNLLKNSDFSDGMNGWGAWGTVNSRNVVKRGTKNWMHVVANNTSQFKGISQTIVGFEPNTEYTISFDAYSVVGDGVSFLLHQTGDGNNDPQIYLVTTVTKTAARYSVTFKTANITTKTAFNFHVSGRNGTAYELYITNMMFALGNVATEWSAASDDTLKSATAEAKRLTDAAVKIVDNKIESTAKDVTQLKSVLGEQANYVLTSAGFNNGQGGIKDTKGKYLYHTTRGMALTVFDGNAIKSHTSYDILNNDIAPKLSEAIAALPTNTYVAITSNDYISSNPAAKVPEALLTLGASQATLSQIKGRDAYILIGRKGMSEGQGVELFGPNVSNSLGARPIDYLLQLVDGVPVGLGSSAPSAEANNTMSTKIGEVDGELKAQSGRMTQLQSSMSQAAKQASDADEIARAGAQGKLIHGDPTFKRGTNNTFPYDNAGTRRVKVERAAKDSDNPTTSTHQLNVTVTHGASPGYGGFVVNGLMGRTNAVWVTKYVMKIPVGYSVITAANQLGLGGTDRFIGNVDGTGRYATYYRVTRNGTAGPFGTFGHVYLHGNALSNGQTMTFQVAMIETFDMTDYQSMSPEAAETMATLTEMANTSATESKAAAEKLLQLQSSFHPQAPNGRMPQVRDESKKNQWTYIICKIKAGDTPSRQYYFQDINTGEIIRKGLCQSSTATNNGTWFPESQSFALFRTWVYVSANKTVKFESIHVDDAISIYVGNQLQYSKVGYGMYYDCSLTFKAGWNIVDVFIGNGASLGGFTLSPILESQVELMCPVKVEDILDNTSASVLQGYTTHADVNSAIASASTTLESKMSKTIDEKVATQGVTTTLDLTKLDPNTYYPVTIALNGPSKRFRFTINRYLSDFLQVPVPWSTHGNRGFAMDLTWETAAAGWGAQVIDRVVHSSSFAWTAQSPFISLDQMSRSSNELVYLRGGALYRMIHDPALAPVIRTTPFTVHDETAAPKPFDNTQPKSLQSDYFTRINETTQSINGIKAVKTVTVDNNGMLSGYGLVSELINNKVVATFGIKADQIFFQSPADGRKPFIFTTTTKEVNGVVYPPGAWIDSAYITNASIKLAHIDKASIGSLSALSATIGLLRTKDHGSRLEIRDNILEVFDDSGQVRVQLGVLS